MTEISTGKKAFDGVPLDTKLAVKICNGYRPELGEGTPKFFVKLAKRCMNSDPKKRPTISVVSSRIIYWLDEIEQDEPDEDDNDIKKQFLEACKIIPNIESSNHSSHMNNIETTNHSSHMYTSKLIDIKKVNEALNLHI
ncbi:4986_t:CDS:1 [Cetraspora pellucida]|uniref:4986_t:CDS:1 n=1 Tax=Cetraspora pellucida TaxID=1433469 RepID=A0A9N8W285_9GLOM|nr:4986_t:CDS:1 [Cetraspora pellucida]